MPLAAGAREGLILGAFLIALSTYFAVRQWKERRDRDEDISDDDRRYFDGKDRRRFANSAVMALIAVGIMVLGWTDPRRPRPVKLAFAGVLVGVSLLVLVLIILAVIDWFATAAYAARHRKKLAEERLAVLEEEVKRLAILRGGPNGRSARDRGV